MPRVLRSERAVKSVEERQPSPPAVRTYRQIARIMGERTGVAVSTASVKQSCRSAERKLARAMLAQPIFRAWLGPGAERLD